MTLTTEQARRVSAILDHATFCGTQEDGNGGSFQLWTLRKPIPGHPVGSTVARATLEKHLFGDYGRTLVANMELPTF